MSLPAAPSYADRVRTASNPRFQRLKGATSMAVPDAPEQILTLLDELNRRHAESDAATIIAATVRQIGADGVAVVSSFGAESAVLLHLAMQCDARLPVVFLDTGKHFPETLAYVETLRGGLGIQNLKVITPDAGAIDRKDPNGVRWSYDPDGCCALRKVEPLLLALRSYRATITGRKAFQSETRARLRHFEPDGSQIKVNPLARWNKARIDDYFAEHQLPRHPLEAEGYLSIGCAPCTSKVNPGEPPRAGRWRGFEKTECGIHR